MLMPVSRCFFFFFFFNDTATTEIYTLSLHDALPISVVADRMELENEYTSLIEAFAAAALAALLRSEEHTSELQSLAYLVCRLLLEKKKKNIRKALTSKRRHSQKRDIAVPRDA